MHELWVGSWGKEEEVKRQHITDILVTKISCLPPAAFAYERSHTHAAVTAGCICTVIARNPDLFRDASDGMAYKETVLLFTYTCGLYGTESINSI